MHTHKWLKRFFIVAGTGWMLFASALCLAMGEAGDAHNHPPEPIPETYTTPQLSLSLSKDMMDGFNLKLNLQHYQLRPPGVNPYTSKALQGHAHLYINGKKISRIYSQYVHVPDSLLHNGVNQLTVTLNSDMHGVWYRGKRQVLATLFIKKEEMPAVVHEFATYPVTRQNSTQ